MLPPPGLPYSMRRMFSPDTRNTHIFLYHATFSQVPEELSKGLHNVAPDVLEQQVRFMLGHFDCLTVDELLALPREKAEGKFAVTFDDAYKCVMEESTDRLLALGVPFTVFVNTATMQGKPFWRDKVRLLMSRDLVKDFLAQLPDGHPLKTISPKKFYKASKSPEINSREVDARMDEFLQRMGIALPKAAHCVEHPEQLPRHKLISYGNHSHSHYVLSSLSPADQRQDIGTDRDILLRHDLHQSQIFSVPFGEERDFTPDTTDILVELGYKGFVYSRNRLNPAGHGNGQMVKGRTTGGLPGMERYKVPDSLAGLQEHIRELEKDTQLTERA